MNHPWLALALGLLLPALAHADDFRCGNHLVTESDTKTTVLAKCGEPARKQLRTERMRPLPQGKGLLPLEAHRRVEEWVYNRGRNQFVQIVRFEGERFVEVRSGGYGW